MRKFLGVLVVTLATMGAAPLSGLAQGYYDSHHDHDRDRVTFRFGDSGFGFGFSSGHHSDWRDHDRRDWSVREERYRYGSSWGGYSHQAPYGHYEYQTETYVVTPGYWSRTFVGNGYSGYYQNIWVAPAYGTRRVTVWVQR